MRLTHVPAELSFAVVSSEAVWIVGGLGAPEILRDSFAPVEACVPPMGGRLGPAARCVPAVPAGG